MHSKTGNYVLISSEEGLPLGILCTINKPPFHFTCITFLVLENIVQLLVIVIELKQLLKGSKNKGMLYISIKKYK